MYIRLALVFLVAFSTTINSVAQEPTLRFVLDGHTDRVQSIAVTGDTIVSGSYDGTVKLWDLNTGMEKMIFEGHEGRVFDVVVSPDGRTVASAGERTIRLWNAVTGQEEAIMEPGSDDATGSGPIAFAPDGQTLASSENGIIRLWNAVTGEERANLSLPSGENCCILSVAFVADGSGLVSSVPIFSGVFGIVVWDLEGGPHRLIEGVPTTEREYILSVAVTKDGRTVATGQGGMRDGTRGALRLWDTATGTLRLFEEGHAQAVGEVAFSPDGMKLASASTVDGTVRLWDVDTGEVLTVLRGLPRFFSVAFSQDGTKLVAAGYEGGGPQYQSGKIMVWDLN